MSDIMPHWLTKQAELSPQKIAIETEDNESLTFLQLKEQSEVFARKLAHLGIVKGNHIGLLSENKLEMVIAIHALSYLGAVSVFLNTRLKNEELNYQLLDANVSLLLTTDKFKEKGNQLTFKGNVKAFCDINNLPEKQLICRDEIDLTEVFTIIYTSGTTGFPKGVMHTYGNHFWSAVGSSFNLGLREDDAWLVVLPLFHVGGLSTLFKSVIYGMRIVLLDGFDEKKVNNIIFSKKITIASVVTVMLQRLIKELNNRSYPDYFRTMLLGGGPVPKHLLEKSRYKNIPVYQSYGMTETCSQIATLSPSDALDKLGSAGKALFPAQLKIDNKDKEGVGEIFVKGLMVTSTYYQNEFATMESFEDNWLKTGDMGYLDDDGFLYIVDRRTDLIISGGENIYPSEIEATLSEMMHIDEVGVAKKKSEEWGEVPVAFIVGNESKISKKDIMNYAKTRLAKYKLPKEIHFINKLPRNATNKLMRRELGEKSKDGNKDAGL